MRGSEGLDMGFEIDRLEVLDQCAGLHLSGNTEVGILGGGE